MAFKFDKFVNLRIILIILVICGQLLTEISAKHRSHRFRCPVLKDCTKHKHKICGSDGQTYKLYDSHCHLRKASCEHGIQLKAVHRHQCDLVNSAFDYEQHGTNSLIGDQTQKTETEDENQFTIKQSEQNAPDVESVIQLNNFNETSSQINLKEEDNGQQQRSLIEECRTEQYELMKYQLVQKVNNDLELLFAQLDENKDGQININELWKKSSIFKPTGSSPCLITDLLQFEDSNQNDFLDFKEFQNAFRKKSYYKDTSGTLDVNMVSLDESLSVNYVQTHLNDNIEIRCDIVGKPQQPTIKWYRNNVDLATLNIPNIKVFNDGLLYLSNVILAFSGNYTCQAENNSIIKQVHIVKVIMTPITKVTPHFHWATIGSSFSVSCEYQCLFDQVHISWTKNDEPIVNNQRITMLNNNTKLELSELSRSDTGAYTCRSYNQIDGAYSQDTVSLVVQDEPVSEQSAENFKSRLWIFHKSGVSIHSIGCSGLLHEMDSRDFIPINGLTLCGGLGTSVDQSKSAEDATCQWSDNAVLLNSKIYIGQSNLNRLIVFDTQHLSVSQVIATDPRPMRLWLVPGVHEDRIWILCYGTDLEKRMMNDEERRIVEEDKLQEDGLFGKFDSNLMQIHQHNLDKYFENDEDEKIEKFKQQTDQFEWKSTSREQQLHNRKTIQILKLASNSMHNENVIHLMPIDGHFDLVYNLFVPKSIDEFHSNAGSSAKSGQEFNNALRWQRWAYASHFDERRLIKIDMENFKYVKSIDLADCHPIDAVHTQFGLLILQCETPVTHQLNGQLILDQITDSIIEYNTDIRASKSYLSPNEQFLISIYHNTSEFGAISSTIIVQKIKQSGLELLYDVKTTLIIVDCDFVWKNGNFDAVLVSASSNREDAIYLTLVDGKVELINGVGRPGKNLKRKIAIKGDKKLGAITSEQSVFIVNLKNKKTQCETDQTHKSPSVVIWT